MAKPDWWRENERIRGRMGLPPYRPPRFADGVHTHETVERLESAFDCEIRFVGVDARDGDDWEVRADGATLFPVARRRDERGNTVYGIESDAFERRVREALGDGGR